MNEDKLNLELRKFLKKVGITSQREIENSVHAALESGKLAGNETLDARVTLDIGHIDLHCTITGKIALEN